MWATKCQLLVTQVATKTSKFVYSTVFIGTYLELICCTITS